jgi:hypothetical protein
MDPGPNLLGNVRPRPEKQILRVIQKNFGLISLVMNVTIPDTHGFLMKPLDENV